MKIETRQEKALILGAETTSFGLNLKDPSVFVQMLLNLYKQPIESVVRECGSNAIDANVESKSDQPVVIGIEGDNFFVRDFGLGLSPDFMNNGYCTIGYSTKRDSEILIGGYGMGRVSPLAYTNQYWVNTVHQGVSYEYLIFLDGNTIKQTLLKSNPTDDPSGTTVTVRIKKYERQEWIDAICQQCAYFDKAVISIDTPKTVEVTFDGLIKTSNLYLNDTHIVFGCVYYPIDWNVFRDWEFLKGLDVGIHIGINEGLVPNPGRESYILNDSAKELLISKFRQISESLWQECNTYLKDLSIQKEIHRLKFLYNPKIPISFRIHYETYIKICNLLGKDIIHINVYPEIKSNVYFVWRTIEKGFDGLNQTNKVYKEFWTKLNQEFCPKGISRNKNRIEFLNVVTPDYTGVEDSQRNRHRLKRHDEIRNELVKQFLEEFTIPFDQVGFEEWKKNRKKEKKETKQGVSYYRKSFTSVTNCVREKGDIDLNKFHYIFTVDSDETAKKFWHSVNKLKKSIILYKDKSGMSASLDDMKPSPFLKRLCSKALRAKVWNILKDKTTNKSVLKLIQEINPLLHQYLVELDLKESPFKEEQQALVEAGELLGCFDKDEMKLKYVEHHLNKLLIVKYLGVQKYSWEDAVFSDEELYLIKRHYILERLAEKKEPAVEVEIPTNQLTLELC